MIFANIASLAELETNYHDNYRLTLGWSFNEFMDLIVMFHEWAPRSYIAKGACEVFWSRAIFRHDFYSLSEAIIDPRATLYVETSQGDDKSVGIPIDLRECVQEVQLFTNPDPYNYAEPTDHDTQSLSNLKNELSQLHEFPHLRRVNLDIWIPQECDAYFEAMVIVESISEACNELKARIGPGLKIFLKRAWPYDFWKFKFIEETDISWMWDKPSAEERDRFWNYAATADEDIRILIADGVGTDAEFTLLEELRYAASFLPQEKEEILDLEAWEPWMGVDEDEWQWLKASWPRESDDDFFRPGRPMVGGWPLDS